MEEQTSMPAVQEDTGLSPGCMSALGVIVILLGVFAISAPLLTTLSIALVGGWLLILVSVVRAIDAITHREDGNLLFGLIIAGLFLIGGVLLISNPVPGVITLTLVLGLVFLIQGLVLVIQGIRETQAIKIVNGVIAGVLGIVVLLGWPDSSQITIGIILGVYLIIEGTGLILGRRRVSDGNP